MGASGHELLLEVEVEGQPHLFLIDSGASVSLVKPGISRAEVFSTNMAARGITGTKLKSLGSQEIKFILGKREYVHEFLVTPLDVEYSGVFGLDLLRLMEAKVDLCSSGLIIGRRRYDLTGLERIDRETTQVTEMTPVVEVWRKPMGLITPEVTDECASTTGKVGAGGLASLVRGELNPDSPYNRAVQ